MDVANSRLFPIAARVVNIIWVLAVSGAALAALFMLPLLVGSGITGKVLPPTANLMVFGQGMALTVPAGPVEPALVRKLLVMIFVVVATETPFILVGIYEVKKILENAARRTPFIIENADRVRVIGLAIIGAAVLAMVRGPLLAAYVMSGTQVAGFRVDAAVDFGLIGTVGIGLVVLLLAEVFRYGIALQEEHDLTV